MVEIWRRSCGSISFRPGFWRGVRSARCRITGPQPWYLLVCPNAGHGRGERIALSHIAGAGALLEVAALVQLITITAGMLAGAVARGPVWSASYCSRSFADSQECFDASDRHWHPGVSGIVCLLGVRDRFHWRVQSSNPGPVCTSGADVWVP